MPIDSKAQDQLTMSEKARVVVVDDHPLFRERLCQLINNEPDMEICGEASSAQEAIQIIREASPNLAVIDITLKTSSGLELIKSIKALSIGVPVLVLSMHDESLYAERALRAGASGYITKSQEAAQVLLAVRSVLGGKIYLSEEMTSGFLKSLAATGTKGIARPLDQRARVRNRVGVWRPRRCRRPRRCPTSLPVGRHSIIEVGFVGQVGVVGVAGR